MDNVKTSTQSLALNCTSNDHFTMSSKAAAIIYRLFMHDEAPMRVFQNTVLPCMQDTCIALHAGHPGANNVQRVRLFVLKEQDHGKSQAWDDARIRRKQSPNNNGQQSSRHGL